MNPFLLTFFSVLFGLAVGVGLTAALILPKVRQTREGLEKTLANLTDGLSECTVRPSTLSPDYLRQEGFLLGQGRCDTCRITWTAAVEPGLQEALECPRCHGRHTIFTAETA